MDQDRLSFEGEEELYEDINSSSQEEGDGKEEQKEELKEELKEAKMDTAEETKEKLEFDNSADEMLHRAEVEWSCLSVDFLLDDRLSLLKKWYDPYVNIPQECFVETTLNNEKTTLHQNDKYPMTVWMVGGSQTGTKQNKLYVMKWENLTKTYSEDSDSDSDSDEEPKLSWLAHNIKGSVNKIRSMQGSTIVATYTESGEVFIMNIAPIVGLLNSSSKAPIPNCLLRSFQLKQEGYAMDWSYCKPGLLALGSCDKSITIIEPHNASMSDWSIVTTIQNAHDASVEDVQCSPNEPFVIASASVDKKLKIWDLRNPSKEVISIIAHDSDVNTISWNHLANYMIASGAENGDFKIWDIRYPSNEPISYIKWHKDQINSIQFSPRDTSSVAVSSADDKVSIWDFGVEGEGQVDKDVPQQLMFVHEGQNEIKELRYHPYYHDLIATTSSDGIHIFRPNFSPISESDKLVKDEKVMDDIILKEGENIE